MNALTTRVFNSQEVRTVTIGDELWFAAADVCKKLGIYVSKRSNAVNLTKMTGSLAEGETAILQSRDIDSQGRCTTDPLMFVSESGLFWLIMRSNIPAALVFQDWFTRDVLPSLRKYGVYMIDRENKALEELNNNEIINHVSNLMTNKLRRMRQGVPSLQ